jgi:hypothetical protein
VWAVRAKVRDAIVVAVLLATGVGVLLAWHPLGPWVSLAMVFAAGLTAIVVYRVEGRAAPTSAASEGAPPAQVP